jgi:hypothetical protein
MTNREHGACHRSDPENWLRLNLGAKWLAFLSQSSRFLLNFDIFENNRIDFSSKTP